MVLCRYEAYVDQKYKEHLKNHGKVDSVGTISTSASLMDSFSISMYSISISIIILFFYSTLSRSVACTKQCVRPSLCPGTKKCVRPTLCPGTKQCVRLVNNLVAVC